MSPAGCPKMSATPCKRNADESFPVLRLKSREQKSPTPLLIQDKDVLQPSAEPFGAGCSGAVDRPYSDAEAPAVTYGTSCRECAGKVARYRATHPLSRVGEPHRPAIPCWPTTQGEWIRYEGVGPPVAPPSGRPESTR